MQNKKQGHHGQQQGQISEEMASYIYRNAATYDEAMKLYYEMMRKPVWIAKV